LGRHSQREITELASRAIGAIADVLGGHDYLMGPRVCGADASVYAFMSGILAPHFDTTTRASALRHSNIVAYCERMRQQFHPR